MESSFDDLFYCFVFPICYIFNVFIVVIVFPVYLSFIDILMKIDYIHDSLHTQTNKKMHEDVCSELHFIWD